MEVEIIIQRAENRYEAVINPDNDYRLTFGLFGKGATVQECLEDLMVCQEDARAIFEKEQRVFPNLEFSYKYDVASFLSYYGKILTLAGLERLTGVAQGQLSHYVNGRRTPSRKTAEKIQCKLRELGAELSKLSFT